MYLNFRESVDFQKNAFIIKKIQNNVPWTCAGHFCIKVLGQSLRGMFHSEEADILDRCGLPLKGGYTWGV